MRSYPRFPAVIPRAGVGSPRAPHPSATVVHPKVVPFDLHALGTPPALFLSQDQTLHQVAHSGHLSQRTEFVSIRVEVTAPSLARRFTGIDGVLKSYELHFSCQGAGSRGSDQTEFPPLRREAPATYSSHCRARIVSRAAPSALATATSSSAHQCQPPQPSYSTEPGPQCQGPICRSCLCSPG